VRLHAHAIAFRIRAIELRSTISEALLRVECSRIARDVKNDPRQVVAEYTSPASFGCIATAQICLFRPHAKRLSPNSTSPHVSDRCCGPGSSAVRCTRNVSDFRPSSHRRAVRSRIARLAQVPQRRVIICIGRHRPAPVVARNIVFPQRGSHSQQVQQQH
jgi:hypothetical protein